MKNKKTFIQDDANTIRLSIQDAESIATKRSDQASQTESKETERQEASSDKNQKSNGEDSIHGGQGRNTIDGGNGDDKLWGDQGADYLLGQNGDDLLVGGSGSDTLKGGRGNDTLIGNAGKDVYTGGPGSDTFILGLSGNSYNVNHEHEDDHTEAQNKDPISALESSSEAHADTITDFRIGVDRIALPDEINLEEVRWETNEAGPLFSARIYQGTRTIAYLEGIKAEDLEITQFSTFYGTDTIQDHNGRQGIY